MQNSAVQCVFCSARAGTGAAGSWRARKGCVLWLHLRIRWLAEAVARRHTIAWSRARRRRRLRGGDPNPEGVVQSP